MKTELSFEEAIKKLETTVKKLESQNSTLEESLKLYEEGVMLSKYCNELLQSAQGKVLKLSDKNNGIFEEFFVEYNVEDK